MSHPISLKEAERSVFKKAYNDGLLDIYLACFFQIFVIAPFLSTTLGDFWSTVVFLPWWGLTYLILWLIRKRVIIPRLGRVKFGQVRVLKLKKLTIVLLVINLVVLVGGIVAALSMWGASYLYPIFLGAQLLFMFSIAAYFLEMNRLYIYGLLTVVLPLVGEWFWQQGLASHHGYPIAFGTLSGVLLIVGIIIFVRVVKNNPLLQVEEISNEA